MRDRKKISILLLFDNKLFREGVKRILESDELHIIGEGSNIDSGAHLIEQYRPDIVLMDVTLPKEYCLKETINLIEKFPRNKIIILTNHRDEFHVNPVLKSGAQGYLLQNTDADTLIKAINVVIDGRTYIDPLVTHHFLKKYRNTLHGKDAINLNRNVEYRKPLHLLTRRECEVLQLLADGKSNRGISKEIYISEKTVKNHVSNILTKMNVNDRTQAVVTAIRKGWVVIILDNVN